MTRINLLSLLFLVLTAVLLSAYAFKKKQKPTIFLIGDSTVKNGGGDGADKLWGWGDFLHKHFDTTKISIRNRARGGRSSRTYITEGLWDQVLVKIKPGDYVIMQFGHNDGGKINDSTRARGTIKGIGDETEEIDNILTGKHEVVHTYGWYMKKYIRDTKEKGGIPIVCSPVARNVWKEGKIERASRSYGKWASEVAKIEGAYFIDLNELVAKEYEAVGEGEVKTKYFITDHTHTNAEGAAVNAALVAKAVNGLKKCPLKSFLKK